VSRVGVSAAILAGGASSRMGTPKATLTVEGLTLIERIVRELALAGIHNVCVVGGDPDWISTNPELRWIPDEFPGEGPLGGIISALASSRDSWVLVLSCDLITPRHDAFETLMHHVDQDVSSHDLQAVVPMGQRMEVLHALYRSSSEQALRAAFDAGVRKVRAAFDVLQVCRVEIVEGSALASSVTDVDTVEEFAEFQRRRRDE
jgi:molybdenum cofactor guanylyltransferase